MTEVTGKIIRTQVLKPKTSSTFQRIKGAVSYVCKHLVVRGILYPGSHTLEANPTHTDCGPRKRCLVHYGGVGGLTDHLIL